MVFILLVLVLKNLPNASRDVEVGDSWQSTQIDLIGPEITLAEVDEELK